jgi:NAD(P)-dependent dehydrogenase (short-subunit alcohol dehydrogenase family)
MGARVWVVTGGAAGLGRATAIRAARQGEMVVIVDRDSERAVEVARLAGEEGLTVGYRRADVSNEDDVSEFVTSIVAEHGRIDVLVNNAGVALREGSVVTLSRKQWDLTIAVNLTSVYLVSHYAVPSMPPGSTVINVATAGVIRSVPGTDAYLAAKGGVVALSKAMAVSLADRCIRVNTVCPNVILTDEVRGRQADPRVQAMMARAGNALGRGPGEPEEFADVVWYLASDQASFINGAVLPIDGGATT